MKKDDYGFYGKGIDGYVHYKQAFDETQKSASGRTSTKTNSSCNNGSSLCTILDKHMLVIVAITVIDGGLALIIFFLYHVYLYMRCLISRCRKVILEVGNLIQHDFSADCDCHYRWPGWIEQMNAVRILGSMSKKLFT